MPKTVGRGLAPSARPPGWDKRRNCSKGRLRRSGRCFGAPADATTGRLGCTCSKPFRRSAASALHHHDTRLADYRCACQLDASSGGYAFLSTWVLSRGARAWGGPIPSPVCVCYGTLGVFFHFFVGLDCLQIEFPDSRHMCTPTRWCCHLALRLSGTGSTSGRVVRGTSCYTVVAAAGQQNFSNNLSAWTNSNREELMAQGRKFASQCRVQIKWSPAAGHRNVIHFQKNSLYLSRIHAGGQADAHEMLG
jgi:hypothetical protein